VHLNEVHRCTIYAKRRTLGYPACEGFDCFGAGQWVTQRLFGGAEWTDSPELASRMFAAYRHWMPRFQAAAMIEAAIPLVRDDARSPLAARMAELTSRGSADNLNEADEHRLRAETLKLIREALRRDGKTT
jgi:hypothetical protein